MTNLENIYLEYKNKVLGYLINKTNNEVIAEDLCSAVFLKITENIGNYDEKKSSLSTWIFCITRNTLYDYFRTNHDAAELDENIEVEEDFVAKLCNDDMLEQLADAIEKLPQREQEFVIRHYYLGQSVKDIADIFNVSITYGYVIHRNALKKLKKIFCKVI